jgi:hypothetical protein
MSDSNPLAPDRALRKFLDVVADEAAANVAFRNRLLMALGTPVIFEGEEDVMGIDPVDLSTRRGEDSFRRIYGTLAVPQLKVVLGTAELATKADVKGLKKPELIDMLWTRARDKAEARGRG